MPELPEVETFRKYFDGTSLNQRITQIEAESPNLIKPGLDIIENAVIGKWFLESSRIGKYMFVVMNDSSSLVFHFGMTGSLHYFKDDEDLPSYTRVLFRFDSGFKLAFVCRRKLGWIDLTYNIAEYKSGRSLGPDALEITFEQFQDRLGGRKSPIKPRLLEQKILAGIGNWIADEMLYQSSIHPETNISKLSSKEWRSLYDSMQDILQIAVDKEAVWQDFPEYFLTHQRDKKDGLCYYTKKSLFKYTVGGRPTYISPIRQVKK